MNNEKKLTFWQKLKISIFDFEKYQDLAAEKVIKTICYIAILVFIFALVVAGIVTYKFSATIANVRSYIDENIETITFENNQLSIVSKNHEEKTNIENEEMNIKIILATQIEDELKIQESIDEINSEENAVLILKDKIVIKNEILTKPMTYSYQTINEQYNINKIDKQEVLNLLSYDTIKPVIFTAFGILLLYFFIIAYLPSTLIDIVILSIFAYIVSSITRIKLKYSAVYNIAAYSLTLPIILNIIYVMVNGFTGFTIKYFEVMYTTIATIYITAAILIIRSDVIKKQIELTKIIEEQDKVRAELQRREEEQKEQEEKERQKKEEEKKRKKEEKKEEKENLGKEPEGNNV